MELKEEIKIGQIWLCKNNYVDAFQKEVVKNEESLVYIVTEVDASDEEPFVRVQPISKNLEYRTSEDVYIENDTFLEAPFIIETWNEQPILIDVLSKPIATISFDLPKPKLQPSFTKKQLTFREEEIHRTAYLRQSVLSSLAIQEKSYLHTRRMNNMKVFSLAASFVGLVFVGWQPGRLSSDNFYDKYATNYEKAVDFKQVGGIPSRGDYYLLPKFNMEESKTIQDALSAFHEEDFKKASDLFQSIDKLQNKNVEFYFYAALSELNLGKSKEAVRMFEGLLNQDELDFHTDLLYYLSMAYIKEGNNRKARKTLKRLENIDENYLDKDSRILKELRWF